MMLLPTSPNRIALLACMMIAFANIFFQISIEFISIRFKGFSTLPNRTLRSKFSLIPRWLTFYKLISSWSWIVTMNIFCRYKIFVDRCNHLATSAGTLDFWHSFYLFKRLFPVALLSFCGRKFSFWINAVMGNPSSWDSFLSLAIGDRKASAAAKLPIREASQHNERLSAMYVLTN